VVTPSDRVMAGLIVVLVSLVAAAFTQVVRTVSEADPGEGIIFGYIDGGILVPVKVLGCDDGGVPLPPPPVH
jgi:hypothetical protein